MGDHTGVFARFYAQNGSDRLRALVYRDVQDDSNEWPSEESRACYASSDCGCYRFKWKHGTSSWYVRLDSASTALQILLPIPLMIALLSVSSNHHDT
jgi:hypothetical protein